MKNELYDVCEYRVQDDIKDFTDLNWMNKGWNDSTRVNEWMDEWMKEWMKERGNAQTNERNKEWMNQWTKWTT